MSSSSNSSRIFATTGAQANGGVKVYDDKKEWNAITILAERIKSGHKHYLIRWESYDATYDTWEHGEADVAPVLINKFDAKVTGIRHQLWLFRDCIAQYGLKLRAERGDVIIDCPGIHGAEAHALLAYLARPPSREALTPLTINSKVYGGRRCTSVELPALDDIASALLLHTVRPDACYGALVHSKGRSQDSDMFFFGPMASVE